MMKVLNHMVDFIKMSKVWSLSMEFYGAWQLLAMRHRHKDQTLDIFIKSMVSLKMSILQIWVTWASKITLKNLQLCSIKMKGSHTPCDVTRSRCMAGKFGGDFNLAVWRIVRTSPNLNFRQI